MKQFFTERSSSSKKESPPTEFEQVTKISAIRKSLSFKSSISKQPHVVTRYDLFNAYYGEEYQTRVSVSINNEDRKKEYYSSSPQINRST